jgi:DNA-binding MarR family transcriptional regulator
MSRGLEMPPQPGPLPTLISVLRTAATLMIDELIARLHAAGYTDVTPAHHGVFENLDPGGTRLTELAARAGITHQSMSELVSVLERRGYLERRADPADGRARIVCLTDKGKQMLRQALKEGAVIETDWNQRLADAGLQGPVFESIRKAVTAHPGRADAARQPTPPADSEI